MAKKANSSSALSLMNGMKKQAVSVNNSSPRSNSMDDNNKVEETQIIEGTIEKTIPETVIKKEITDTTVVEAPTINPTPMVNHETNASVDVDSNDLLKSLVAKEKKNVKKSFLLSQKNADALKSAHDQTGVSENEILHQILKQFFNN